MKKVLYSEISYALGQILLSFGAALITTAGFGVSMVVAPAYLISERVPFLTFGMAEYSFQALLLCVFCIVMGRFRAKYLLSFVTAFIYGCLLDGFLALCAVGAPYGIAARIALFVLGEAGTVAGVVFFFKSYIPPEVYELFVQEVSRKFGFEMGRVKWIYDIASLALSVLMSLAFFGAIRGIGIGTLICAAVNGGLISLFSKFIDSYFEVRPALRVPSWMS